jgi:sortase A
MEIVAAERGGPFGWNGMEARNHGAGNYEARNWMRASAPGIAFRCRPAESSPVGSVTRTQPQVTARPRRARRIALIVLLVCAGLVCFGNGLYIYAKAQAAQLLLHAAWDRTRMSGAPFKPWPWADTHPVARLIAPGHDADLLVLSGASGRTLAFGPALLDGSANPGEMGNSVGNTVITGHRDTHFRFLRDVAAGDSVVVEDRTGTRRHFHVRRTYVADFRALDIPRDTPTPTLTLVTCYPFDAINPGGPLRYVVVAEAG